MKILHVLNFSLPFRTSGYCIRSKYIVDIQKLLGLEPIVITKHQISANKSLSKIESDVSKQLSENKEYLDGILYLRDNVATFSQKRLEDFARLIRSERLFLYSQKRRFQTHISRAVKKYSPDLIHVASPAQNALVAIEVGRRFRLPVVYEVRGLWHDTSVTLGKLDRLSNQYRQKNHDLFFAMKMADYVVTLSEAMKNEFIQGGLDPQKISIVPNGIDVSKFRPRKQPKSLRAKLGIHSDDIVLGYIGSIRRLEGLHWLIRAGKILLQRNQDIKILIVGEGEDLEPLQMLAKGLELGEATIFTGQVPHEDVVDYYALIDIFVVPRSKSRVTDLVTPLKPYEAMAMEKAVIVSNVGALREIIDNGNTGIECIADDPEDLAQKCQLLMCNQRLRIDLGRRANTWVREHRQWQVLIERYQRIYERLV